MGRNQVFPELVSKHLKNKIQFLKDENRYEDAKKLELQYLYNQNEDDIVKTATNRHYEADIGANLAHVERLYAHHCCIEINFVCKAHCRYCLRSNYDKWTISKEEINHIIDYINKESLSEVLITGGDPFLTVPILESLAQQIHERCKSIKIVRVATRVITQAPEYIVNNESGILTLLEKMTKMFRRVEVATQINTWVELDDECVEKAIESIQSLGAVIYSQNVFLKGINDSAEELIKLYTYMRNNGIEAHYLFHCCDIKGAAHFRTSVHDMVRCYEKLVNSGSVSGRCKPLMALMTPIGKIVLTDLNAMEYKGDSLILRSCYKYEDRIRYNPNWKLPSDAWVDKDGYIWCEYRGEALQFRVND